MSGETIRTMALWRLHVAACRKSPVCPCSAAASGGLEHHCESFRKVFENHTSNIWVAMHLPPSVPNVQTRELQMPGIVGVVDMTTRRDTIGLHCQAANVP